MQQNDLKKKLYPRAMKKNSRFVCEENKKQIKNRNKNKEKRKIKGKEKKLENIKNESGWVEGKLGIEFWSSPGGGRAYTSPVSVCVGSLSNGLGCRICARVVTCIL